MDKADLEITEEQFIDDICRTVEKITTDESLVKGFEEIARESKAKLERLKKSRRRGDNFRVTDIVNPMHAYFDIKNGNLVDPPDLKSKFDYGNRMENKVKNILLKDPNFTVSQGDVCGDSWGLNDVRGRIDFRLGDMLIEFKTSEEDVPDEEAVFCNHPQDLEQLILYVLFTNRQRDEHRLLYLTGRYPENNIRCFKVKIRNAKKVAEYFVQRRDKLKESLKTSNYSGLGKCRYFSSLCKFKINHMCSCSTEQDIDIQRVKENVSLEFIRGDLDTKINDYIKNKDSFLGFWDIFTPRRFFLSETHPFEFLGGFDNENRENFQLRKQIEYDLQSKGLIKRNMLGDAYPKFSEEYLSIEIDKNAGSEKKQTKKFPIIIRVSNQKTGGGEYKLRSSYKAQIGLICSLTKSDIGYIFVFFKNSNTGILKKLKFTNLRKIKATSSKLMLNIQKSLAGNIPPSKLPECPEFIKNKKCYNDCLCNSESCLKDKTDVGL